MSCSLKSNVLPGLQPWIFAVVFATFVSAALGETGYVNDGGELVILYDEPTPVLTLLVRSEGGYLVPLPSADTTADPSPWEITFRNDAFEVQLVNLVAEAPLLEGIFQTGILYTPPPDVLDLYVLAGWRTGQELRSPTLICVGAPCAVPEPAPSLLLVLGVGCLLSPRVRRRL